MACSRVNFTFPFISSYIINRLVLLMEARCVLRDSRYELHTLSPNAQLFPLPHTYKVHFPSLYPFHFQTANISTSFSHPEGRAGIPGNFRNNKFSVPSPSPYKMQCLSPQSLFLPHNHADYDSTSLRV
jgi:hypothetical protein